MNRTEIIEGVVASQLKPENAYPKFSIGDTIDVHYRIIEGDKERVQVFQGVFIAEKGRGINKTITVRRIVANEGVERIFPIHSPRLAKIDLVRRGDARRAKLFYLRDRFGKARRLRDQRRGLKQFEAEMLAVGETAAPAEGKAEAKAPKAPKAAKPKAAKASKG